MVIEHKLELNMKFVVPVGMSEDHIRDILARALGEKSWSIAGQTQLLKIIGIKEVYVQNSKDCYWEFIGEVDEHQ